MSLTAEESSDDGCQNRLWFSLFKDPSGPMDPPESRQTLRYGLGGIVVAKGLTQIVLDEVDPTRPVGLYPRSCWPAPHRIPQPLACPGQAGPEAGAIAATPHAGSPPEARSRCPVPARSKPDSTAVSRSVSSPALA